MAAKKLSLRAQAHLKRENRQLRARLADVLASSWPGTLLSRLTPNDVELAKIQTAHKLDFAIVIRDTGSGSISLHAVKRGEF